MVLAETEEVDVLHDHHLVVVLDEHGVVQDFLHVLVVARGEIPQGVRHALGRLLEPLALRVLTELLQELRDQLFEHHAPPRYSNRFFAVSTTLTRRSRASPTAGLRIRQNARARPSPVVITPRRASTPSSASWSTRSRTARPTVASSRSRSSAMPVTGSGRPATVTSR